MGPGDLARALSPLPHRDDPRLLVGRETFDDAGVFLVSDDLALVRTVDFFAPIVDDPYTFGRIAAANALSDVYAMGGEPLTALNIVGFPNDKLPLEVLAEILRGADAKIRAAAAKRGDLGTDEQRSLIESMATLNRAASVAARDVGARCATDVTGFGL